jgi:hypothetical protein
MLDLELARAEMLPARGTLCCSCQHHPGDGGSSFAQVGYGNTAQAGLVNVAAPSVRSIRAAT